MHKACFKCGRSYRTEDELLHGTSRWRRCARGNLWFNCSCDSTLMLPKECDDLIDPVTQMSANCQELLEQYREVLKIPCFPSAALDLVVLLEDPSIDTKVIVERTLRSPILASHILVMANVLRGAGTREIEDLEHAINYVGRPAIKSISIISAVRSFRFPETALDEQVFWTESLQVGSIAKHLVTLLPHGPSPEKAFMAGSLCNIGKIVMCLSFPDVVEEVVAEMQHVNTQCSWLKAERRCSAPSHSSLGELTSASWGLPAYIEPSFYHHSYAQRPPGEASEARQLREVVTLGNQLRHWIYAEPHRVDEALAEKVASALQLPSPESLVESIRPVADAVDW